MLDSSWISSETIVTDVLAALGLIFVLFSPFIFATIQKKVLKSKLHTRSDGEKIFEKLKYDLKLSKIESINKKLLFKDIDYARTIFSGAMEYNSRDLILYFNEKGVKKYINSQIYKKAWMHFLLWVVIMAIIMGGTYLDFFHWIFQSNTMSNTSGFFSIWVLVILGIFASIVVKFLEYQKIKMVINNEVRQINLTKKEAVWKDYKIIYWYSIGFFFFSWILIFINMFF